MTKVLSSWSRRRAAVAAEAAEQERAAEEAIVAQEQAALSEKSDEEILEELGLPDPDTLVQGDDFKAFLSKAVPERLRKRALRNLWRSNPVLACVDGLNDYDDDYLTGSFGQGPISTSYQVGKGMLYHLLEMERQKEADLVTVQEAPLAEEPEEEIDGEEEFIAESEAVDVAMSTDEDEEVLIAPAPRRMKFQFEDDAV